jgi:hypothetical protein
MCSKKIKDKYVSQCGAIVRDNMPISYREWKGKAVKSTRGSRLVEKFVVG